LTAECRDLQGTEPGKAGLHPPCGRLRREPHSPAGEPEGTGGRLRPGRREAARIRCRIWETEH
jgi:hypothetical protein